MHVATTILAKVEAGRLRKAVESLVSGTYAITVTGQGEAEMRGFVANGDGKQYGVVLTEEHAFCSCPDAMYRKAVCKHAVALALYVIRNPRTEQPTAPIEPAEEPAPYDLKLVKTRKGYAFPA